MKALAFFAGGIVTGWMACSWAVRQVIREKRAGVQPLGDISGTISSPDGEWEFTGATLTQSPWTRRTSTKR